MDPSCALSPSSSAPRAATYARTEEYIVQYKYTEPINIPRRRSSHDRVIQPQSRSAGIGGYINISRESGIGCNLRDNKDSGIGKICVTDKEMSSSPRRFSLKSAVSFGSRNRRDSSSSSRRNSDVSSSSLFSRRRDSGTSTASDSSHHHHNWHL